MITALVTLLAIGLVAAVVMLRPGQQASSIDCTAYGLSSDDPRMPVERVELSEEAVAEDRTNAGALGELSQTFTANGLTSGYHVIDGGVDPSQPVGLVMHLHGDGGEEYFEPGGRATCLAAVAASHNALLVVPLTPDCQGDCTWWERLDPNLAWLRALVEDRLLQQLPVAPGRITWMGYSGGAEMLSYGLLRSEPDLATGGAVMVGGGGAPTSLEERPSAPQQATQRLWWVTGARDDGTDPAARFDAVEAAARGHEFYAQRGYDRTRLDLLDGHDHFDMPDARILDELLRHEEEAPTRTGREVMEIASR